MKPTEITASAMGALATRDPQRLRNATESWAKNTDPEFRRQYPTANHYAMALLGADLPDAPARRPILNPLEVLANGDPALIASAQRGYEAACRNDPAFRAKYPNATVFAAAVLVEDESNAEA